MLVEFLTDEQYKPYTSETSETKKQLVDIRRRRKKLIHNAWLAYNYSEKVFILQHLTYSFDSRLDNLKVPFVLECLDDENETIQRLGSHLLFLFFCRLVCEKFIGSSVFQCISGFDDIEILRDFSCLWGNYDYIESKTRWEEIVDNFFQNNVTSAIIQYIWDVTEFMIVNNDILDDSSIDCLIDFIFERSVKQVLKGYSTDFLKDFAIENYELFPKVNSRFIASCCDILIHRIALEDLYQDTLLHTQDVPIKRILTKLCIDQKSDIQTDWKEFKIRLEQGNNDLINQNYYERYDDMYVTPELVDLMSYLEFFEDDDEDLSDVISFKLGNMNRFSNPQKTQTDDEEEILNRFYNDEGYIGSLLDDIERFENGSFDENPDSWDL